jgi:hypothetical protein
VAPLAQANVGLLTGARFDVLDLDGPQRVEALRAALSQRYPHEHPGPVARTGWHLLYALPGSATGSGCCPGGLARPRRPGRRTTLPARLRPPLPVGPAAGRRAAAVPDPLGALLAPPARPAPAPPPLAPGRGYGTAALAGEAARVAAAGLGGRQHALNVAALKLGRLVAAGHLEEARVYAELAAAQPAGSVRGPPGQPVAVMRRACQGSITSKSAGCQATGRGWGR